MSATRVPVPFRERQRDDDLTVYEEVSLAVADGRSEQLNERQQAVLNGAVADEVSELELIQNMTEEIMLADPLEQTQQMQ